MMRLRHPADARVRSITLAVLAMLASLVAGPAIADERIVQSVRAEPSDAGWSVDRAANSSRIHFENDLLSVEGGHPDEVADELGKSFANLQRWDERNLFFGGAHTVVQDGDGFSGAGDARRGGVVVTVP